MEDLTITRAHIVDSLYQEIGLSREDASSLLQTVLEEISTALSRGDMVKLSSFGTFAVRQKGTRMGRNPRTGEEVPILPRKVLIFRASHVLRDRINQRPSGAADVARGDEH